MKKALKIIIGVIIFLFLLFLLGPKANFEDVNNVPISLNIPISKIDNYIEKHEEVFEIKYDNHARIIWADSIQKTPYSFVYLHGFSASIGEAKEIMTNLIKRYGYNAYISRLSHHGLTDDDAMLALTPKSWIESAKQAIAIGKVIGEKVIIISTSTGSTLATFLATNEPDVSDLVMMSPNFDLYDTNSRLMMIPWGKQILKYISKGDYHYWNISDTYVQAYWNTKKRIEALIALRDLVDQTMTEEVFTQVSIPYYIGYYYKDEEHKDEVISIEAIQEFHSLSQTPAGEKTLHAYSEAQGHVIGCQQLNADWESVQNDIFDFLDKQIKFKN